MSVTILKKYILFCEAMNMDPTVPGLKKFKKAYALL